MSIGLLRSLSLNYNAFLNHIATACIYSHVCFSQVSSYLNLSDITLHLAVSLFDRTLAVVEVEEEQLQITAITCLHLAAKVWMTQFESVQSVRSS